MPELQGLLVEDWSQLLAVPTQQLLVKRDDLLPFPLAGNKVRKLMAELAELAPDRGDVLITNGGLVSNYARTLAFMAAPRGLRIHLVLHADTSSLSNDTISLQIYESLGAVVSVVPADEIASTIALTRARYELQGNRVHVLTGGGHSGAGAEAMRVAAVETLRALPPIDLVVVASGTGATQAGIAVAAAQESPRTRVVGVSVARSRQRGIRPIEEAVEWLKIPARVQIEFVDDFRDDGYGKTSAETREVVAEAWRHGLPLDGTYTGKAFRGMLALTRELSPEARILFWHTGGLTNQLEHMIRSV